MHLPFDLYTEDYDRWFDTKGWRIFRFELRAVCDLLPPGKTLEVGVGTGRFAELLGVEFGLDPSLPSLKLAKRRIGYPVQGIAERLPFRDGSFDAVLVLVSVCFLDSPERAFAEVYRVLKTDGRLIVGYIPADTRWGHLYRERAHKGHRFYSHARFWSGEELDRILDNVGFEREALKSVVTDGRTLGISKVYGDDSIFVVERFRKI